MPPLHIKSRKCPPMVCPGCHQVLDGCTGLATQPERTIPHDGSVSICFYCRTMAVIADGAFRAMTRDEWNALPEANRAFIFELSQGRAQIHGEGPV